MAKKEKKKQPKKVEERTFITSEELQNMKFNLSIDIPKEAFDELLKAMMGMDKKSSEAANQ